MRSLNVLIFVSVVAVGGCVTSAGSTTEALTGATVTTDAPQYLLEQPIAISWTGLPGNAKDWVAYAPAGSTDTTVTRWVYTGGAVSGSVMLEGAATDGTYVARAFVNDSYAKLAESQPVAVMSCGTATGPVRTKVLAANPAGIPSYGPIDVVNLNIGNVTLNLDGYFTAGDRIHAIRLYVQDNTQPGPCVGCSGPTRLISHLKLYAPPPPGQPILPVDLAASNVSDGSGTVQVLTIPDLDVAVGGAGGATHSLQTIDFAGVAPAVVWSVEVDYTPSI